MQSLDEIGPLTLMLTLKAAVAFVCKGHVTNHQRWSISYQHAKFEQNQSINTKVTFLKATAAFIWPLIVKAAAPTLTLKVLINFGVGLVTGY